MHLPEYGSRDVQNMEVVQFLYISSHTAQTQTGWGILNARQT